MEFDSGVTQEAWNFVIAVRYIPSGRSCLPARHGLRMRKKDKLAGILTTLKFLLILVLIIIIA